MSPRTLPTGTTLRSITSPLRAALYGRASSDPKKRGRSIKDQFAVGEAECEDRGWTIVGYYEDRDRSASRKARKVREKYEKMVAEAQAGLMDVIVYAERSRTSRNLDTSIKLRTLCKETGVLLFYDGRLYDMNVPADFKEFTRDSVQSEEEAESIIGRAQRTARLNALRGAPHGKVAFGFARKYDPDEGHLLGQEAHPKNAALVRNIFDRAAAGQSIKSLLVLYRTHVPDATRAGLRYMLRNRAYIGIRSYNGQDMEKCQWDGIVDEEVFWEVQAILDAPTRATERDTRVKHLLSGLALCVVCVASGHEADAGLRVTSPTADPRYRCEVGNHVAIGRDRLDAYVEDLVFRWMASGEAAAAFRATASSGEVSRLRTRMQNMQTQVTDARAKATTFNDSGLPLLSIEALALTEQQLLPRIAEDEATLRSLTASQDPLVARLVGEPVGRISAVWNEELTMAQRRHVLRQVVNVELRRASSRGVHSLEPGRVGIVFAGEPGFRAGSRRGGGRVRGT